MKNDANGGKLGSSVEGEMSSSSEGGVGCVGLVNACVYVCVCVCVCVCENPYISVREERLR
jgi:hypothetical protein